ATLAAVASLGFTTPTPVQVQAIPLALQGRDVVAAAKTGTGKTAAFLLPTLDRVSADKHGKNPRVLIVSPTRELAQQSADACNSLTKTSRHRMLTVVGGTPYGPQMSKLKRGIDILIATPGRLFDLMERRAINLSQIEVLVLDEADRMLDMGFWPTMQKIIAETPAKRQTLLFSATIDRKVMKSVESILNNPAFVEISHKGETADTVEQFIMAITQAKKPDLLRAVLEEKGSKRIIVFARTKGRTDSCSRFLREAGYSAEAIHSDRSQRERKRALDNFSRGRTDILVATDVLARGIDVSDVNHVINYDLPDCPEDYVHRIGRTGRAGEAGLAVSFVSSDAKSTLRDIERLIGKEIPFMEMEGFDCVQTGFRSSNSKKRPNSYSKQYRGKGGSSYRKTSSSTSGSGRNGEKANGEGGYRGNKANSANNRPGGKPTGGKKFSSSTRTDGHRGQGAKDPSQGFKKAAPHGAPKKSFQRQG
ncbi:MAG: DEAD/DEAH box helicase, partial [Raoultibacter sp.]